MSRRVFDLVIVGGGPAGCMAAISAIQESSGLKVCIIDKEAEAPHRIGEALLTGTMMSLADVGVIDDIVNAGFHKKIGAAYLWGESRHEPWYVNYPSCELPYPESLKHENGRYSLHVPRHKFDEILRDKTREMGAEFIIGQPIDYLIQQDEKRVISAVLESGEKIFSSYWIDATGQSSSMARKVTVRNPVGSPRTARYGYFNDLDWDKAESFGFDLHRTNIISSEAGWFWVIHLGEAGDNLTSLGFVSTPDVMRNLAFSNAIDAYPELNIFGFGDKKVIPRDHVGNPMEKAIYKHSDYSYRCDELQGVNWALVGDAALFLDPILSQGVTLAVHYGVLRGRAAVAALGGNHHAQAVATEHYLNEAEVLHRVVMQWYSNNRSVSDWKLNAFETGKTFFDIDGDLDDAFRYVTNLENVFHEYHPFDRETRKSITGYLGG
jgi:flavin-dependent dehydrogenase